MDARRTALRNLSFVLAVAGCGDNVAVPEDVAPPTRDLEASGDVAVVTDAEDDLPQPDVGASDVLEHPDAAPEPLDAASARDALAMDISAPDTLVARDAPAAPQIRMTWTAFTSTTRLT